MADTSRIYKVQRKEKEKLFTEVAETDTSINEYPKALISCGGWGDPPEMYRAESDSIEKITCLKREETDSAKSRFKLAHTNLRYVKKENVKNVFKTLYIGSRSEDQVFPEFSMEYTTSEKITRALSNCSHFEEDETIIITTEKSGDITVNYSDVEFISRYGSHYKPYKFKITLNKNLLDLVMYSRSFSSNSKLECNEKMQVIRCNLDTGLIYQSTDEETPLSDMKNATTGHAGDVLFNELSDDIIDTLVNITKEYMDEKYGLSTECVSLHSKTDTFKGYVFNPLCNVMYLYKPFFNTRFRTYFKREDTSVNHFETLCDMLKIPYDKKFVELAAEHHQNIFLVKCIYDAGIKDANNIVSIINAAVKCDWMKYPLRMFVEKYYGEQTDFLLHQNNYNIEYRSALCTYITKALTYVDENAFTEMFVRSTAQHSKYWKRSLVQVATLIEINDFDRELMRKACSYGLNKIQSDAIDLAYDKILTKNKFIRYNSDEMALEKVIGDFYFKRPIDMHEITDFTKDIGKENKELPLDAARKLYNVMFVKDDRGENLAYIITRNNDLVDVVFTKRSLRHSTDEIIEVCKTWVKDNKIRQYFCDKLKEEKPSLSFMSLPF